MAGFLRSLSSSLIGGLLISFGLSLVSLPVFAQDGPPTVKESIPYDHIHPNWRDCGLRPYDMAGTIGERFERDALRGPRSNQTQTAEIVVDYGPGFTSEARTAFERAVEIWERHITSPVPIRIDASFSDLGPNVLGGAGPNFVFSVDTDNDGANDTIFGDALIDALTGEDQNPGQPDIVAQFSSTRTDWNFGTDEASDNEIDFTSVVLHEIGHGINYFDLLSFDDGTGSYGLDFNDNGVLDPDEKVPGVFEQFLFEDRGTERVALTNPGTFANPSTALGDALTGQQLVFEGSRAVEGAAVSTGPALPKIYAPFSWSPGSSIAHLDEATYGPGDPNSLMSPQFGRGETIRSPGPIMCGQLADIGWPLGTECQKLFRDVFGLDAAVTSVENGAVTLTWQTTDNAQIDTYFVEQKTFDGEFDVVETLEGGIPPSVTLDELGLGQFTFRLRWVAADGTEQVSVERPQATLSVQDVNVSVERTDLGRGTIQVEWDVPRGTNGFQYEVERSAGIGSRLETDPENRNLTRLQTTFPKQQPGRYTFRVVARSAEEDTLRSAAQTVDVSFEGDVTILGPFPNPAANTTTVELTARDRQDVHVEVFNTLGQRLFSETRSLLRLAPVTIRIDGRRWASGMYFLRVTGETFTKTEQLVIL